MAQLAKAEEKLIRSLRRRVNRGESGLCVCEGTRACSELLAANPGAVRLAVARDGFDTSAFPGVDFKTLPPERFQNLSDTTSPQGLLFLAQIPPGDISPDTPAAGGFSLILDRIGDPGNFGTIARSAKAAGLRELWLTAGTVDPFSEKSIRAGLAAQFSLRIRTADSLPQAADTLRRLGRARFYRTEPAGGADCFQEPQLFEDSAIILGGEAFGAAALDGALPLNIPMPGGSESLNVAQAATIILFESVRRSRATSR